MRLDCGQIARRSGPLAPVTLLFGDEPLLVEEASDQLCAVAIEQGYTERTRLMVEKGFDWNELIESGQSLSLFAERRLIELRLPTGKPGAEGGAILAGLAENPPEDTIVIVISGRIDSSGQKTKWFKTVEKHGLVAAAPELKPEAFPGWLKQRMTSRGLQPDEESIALLSYYFEGNLLAAAQEIDRLQLLMGETGDGISQQEMLRESVSDNTRFNPFNFIDACVQGDSKRTLRMLDGLRGEGEPSALVLFLLAKEIRNMTLLAWEINRGARQDDVFRRYRVWKNRQRVVAAGLRRHGYDSWRSMLRQAARLDKIMKGRATSESHDVWFDIERLSLRICGTQV